MRRRWSSAAGALAVALLAAACGDDAPPPAPAPAPVAAVKAAPPPPRPAALPPGHCCCEADLRGDRVVQVAPEADCSKRSGACAAPERCWLADPPAVSGAADGPTAGQPAVR